MTKQTDVTKLPKGERVARAAEGVRITRAAYVAEWKRDGTAKNYPNVDRKLDALHEAEREQRLAAEA